MYLFTIFHCNVQRANPNHKSIRGQIVLMSHYNNNNFKKSYNTSYWFLNHIFSFSAAFQLTVRRKSRPSEAAMSRQTSAVFLRTALSVMSRWVVELPSGEKRGWKLWMKSDREITTATRNTTVCLLAMLEDKDDEVWWWRNLDGYVLFTFSPLQTFLFTCFIFFPLLSPHQNTTEHNKVMSLPLCLVFDLWVPTTIKIMWPTTERWLAVNQVYLGNKWQAKKPEEERGSEISTKRKG